MKYEVLYYPNFEPGHRWLRSVLLFVDTIWRIIPSDIEHEDSIQTNDLIRWMPEALRTITPNKDDVDIKNFNLNRLDLAFAKIRESKGRPRKGYELEFSGSHVLPMQGDVWLAKSKANDDVIELLYKHGLAFDLEHPNGNLVPVQEDAANCIVSYVADNIAARTGLDTVTDCEVPYAIRSFDSLGLTKSGFGHLPDSLLVSAGAFLSVPANVERLSPEAFQELRHSYKYIRPAFFNLMQSFARRVNLYNQRSAEAFERKFSTAIEEYQREFEKYKRTAFAKRIDDWMPFSIQSFLLVATAIWPALAPVWAIDSVFSRINETQY